MKPKMQPYYSFGFVIQVQLRIYNLTFTETHFLTFIINKKHVIQNASIFSVFGKMREKKFSESACHFNFGWKTAEKRK